MALHTPKSYSGTNLCTLFSASLFSSVVVFSVVSFICYYSVVVFCLFCKCTSVASMSNMTPNSTGFYHVFYSRSLAGMQFGAWAHILPRIFFLTIASVFNGLQIYFQAFGNEHLKRSKTYWHCMKVFILVFLFVAQLQK